MPDREKVIKGLECCTFILGKRKCDECPYAKGADYGPDCYSLMPDVKALLKAQEPRPARIEGGDMIQVGYCPNCGKLLQPWGAKYCYECGQAVMWE